MYTFHFPPAYIREELVVPYLERHLGEIRREAIEKLQRSGLGHNPGDNVVIFVNRSHRDIRVRVHNAHHGETPAIADTVGPSFGALAFVDSTCINGFRAGKGEGARLRSNTELQVVYLKHEGAFKELWPEPKTLRACRSWEEISGHTPPTTMHSPAGSAVEPLDLSQTSEKKLLTSVWKILSTSDPAELTPVAASRGRERGDKGFDAPVGVRRGLLH
ncbi:unnamed protein product [Pedinophyceae sp. YPF-701]|nr:unnamed protein product [Pedinophyceae sp. YPF-701]